MAEALPRIDHIIIGARTSRSQLITSCTPTVSQVRKHLDDSEVRWAGVEVCDSKSTAARMHVPDNPRLASIWLCAIQAS